MFFCKFRKVYFLLFFFYMKSFFVDNFNNVLLIILSFFLIQRPFSNYYLNFWIFTHYNFCYFLFQNVYIITINHNNGVWISFFMSSFLWSILSNLSISLDWIRFDSILSDTFNGMIYTHGKYLWLLYDHIRSISSCL